MEKKKPDEKSIREYYMCGSTLLHNALIKLGYKEDSVNGRGLNKVTTYKYKDRVIKDSFNSLSLTIENSKAKPISRYMGKTISKDILTFFTQREDIKIKANDPERK